MLLSHQCALLRMEHWNASHFLQLSSSMQRVQEYEIHQDIPATTRNLQQLPLGRAPLLQGLQRTTCYSFFLCWLTPIDRSSFQPAEKGVNQENVATCTLPSSIRPFLLHETGVLKQLLSMPGSPPSLLGETRVFCTFLLPLDAYNPATSTHLSQFTPSSALTFSPILRSSG